MITMFGDYLIFQHNIACTFLRRWGQIITFDSTKEQLDSNFDCTLSLALFCRSLFLGWGGRQLCIQPLTKPPDSWLQRLGRFNRQVACIYWGLRPLSVCQLTGALGEKQFTALRLLAINWKVQKQLAGNHCLTGYISGAYVLCHYIPFICLFLYYRHTRIVSLSSSPFEARI